MIVSDIFIQVKRQFGDESGVQLTESDILRYINEGQRQIVMQNEGLLEKTATANAVVGQQEYDPPVDMLILQGISYKSPDDVAYYKLKGLSYQQFNEYVDGWDGDAYSRSTPLVYSVFASKILLFPIPDRSKTSAIKVFYNRTPVDVAASPDTPDLPLLYHDALVKHCLKMAYEMDEDWDAAQAKGSQLDADVAVLRGREGWKNEEVYPTITIRFEDQF